MNIAIVDDELLDIRILEKYLQIYASLHQTSIEIETFQNPEEFLASDTP